MDRSHLDFVLALHHQLPAEGNLCWSPYSVAAALGLAAAGARGTTQAELAAALAPGSDLATLTRLLVDAAEPADAEAAVVNSLWLERELSFQPDFSQTARSLPGGAVHSVDFQRDPEGSRLQINEDVALTTRGLIRDLLAAGMITPETAAVIVNALYLKVAWQSPFTEGATAPATFHTTGGSRQVPMMRQQESFGYAAGDGWRLASLPTASPTVLVEVLLPDDGAAPLTVDLLSRLQRSARPRKLDLALPRLRVARALTLNPALRQLGVAAAFQPGRADFAGITAHDRLVIDLVVHQAVLRADEQGFEGAAATAVVMRLVSMDLSTPLPFHVDRPFLLLVRHRQTGAVYFVARVEDPTAG